MAFSSEEDLSCPVCHDVFNDPVILSCSHSFCDDCVKSWWRDKQKSECPVCKTVTETKKPPRNLALKNLCEAFLLRRSKSDSETLCGLHSEKFKLFCLDHQQPVCIICRDSKAHNNHRFRPIGEVAQEAKEVVQKLLVPTERKLKLTEGVKESVEEMSRHIKVQAEQTERKIKEQFEKLHKFLQKEEKVRINAVKNEEKTKSKRMRQRIEDLDREIDSLSDTIRVTELELRGEDTSFLQNYKTAVKRIQESAQTGDAHLCSGDLIDVAKHLGNLSHPVWNKMEEMGSFTPVILDPNTAHPHLHLSDDLTSLRYGQRRKVPPNQERISYYRCVLGSEGFDSGSHIWDVEVGDANHWELGVAARSAHRKKHLRSGLWVLKFEQNQYSAISPTNKVRLHQVQRRFEKIRVHLRCDRGSLLFFDLETGTHLHTFTHIFNETLFPYFSNGSRSPVKILPLTGSTKIPPLIMITVILSMLVLLSIQVWVILLARRSGSR